MVSRHLTRMKARLVVLTSITIMTAAFIPSAHAADVVAEAATGSGPLKSWIALMLVASSFLCAWSLNYSAPKVRVFGTVLASLGCFAIAGWFLFYILGTGFLENPKPNQTPMDSAKPILLWLQSMTALAAGFILFIIAIRQSKNTETLTITAHNEDARYGRVSRVLHWTIAFLFLILIPMGIFASIIPENTAYRNDYYVVHKTLGVITFALILIRLFWNFKSKRPSLDGSLKPRERKLAHGVHILLYGFMIAIPVTGFVMTSFHGYPTFFFEWELNPLWGQSQTGTIIWGMMHKYLLPYLLYIILGAHVLGALKHHFVDKHEAALKRMVG